MRTSIYFALVLTGVFFVSGCATTQAQRKSVTESGQIQALQNELQIKEQQIQELQYQLEMVKAGTSTAEAAPISSKKSSSIRVSGVSAAEVQKALAKAGFDPGPVDGRIGKKTKEAIKEFQRRNGLKADGIVGERTWSFLRS